jgi:hypothetical protein
LHLIAVRSVYTRNAWHMQGYHTAENNQLKCAWFGMRCRSRRGGWDAGGGEKRLIDRRSVALAVDRVIASNLAQRPSQFDHDYILDGSGVIHRFLGTMECLLHMRLNYLEWLTTQLATVISFIRSVEDKGN